jgi:hypothetical protein
VYWGNPVPDAQGNYTFDSPVEIFCRWEGHTEVISDGEGKDVISKARLLVTQDVDEGGYICLGTIATLGISIDEVITMDNTEYTMDDTDITMDNTGTGSTDPHEVNGAWEIKRFDKIPMFRSTSVFVRIAYL